LLGTTALEGIRRKTLHERYTTPQPQLGSQRKRYRRYKQAGRMEAVVPRDLGKNATGRKKVRGGEGIVRRTTFFLARCQSCQAAGIDTTSKSWKMLAVPST
jgi:hypothetical protein